MDILALFRKQRVRKQKEMEDAERYLFDESYTIVKGSEDILAFAQYTMAEYRLWEDASLREARSRGRALTNQYPGLDLTEEELWDVHVWNVTTLYEEVKKGLKVIDRGLVKYLEEKEKAPREEQEEAKNNVKLALLTLWDIYRHNGNLLTECPTLERLLPRSYI